MSELTRKAKKSPNIRATAERLVSGLRQKDRFGEISALFDYVQNGVRYLRDTTNVETLIDPEQMLIGKTGDCDDKSMLLASLLESIGYSTRFVAVACAVPGKFDHVFIQVQWGKNWLSMDATENRPLGWQPPNPHNYMIRNN